MPGVKVRDLLLRGGQTLQQRKDVLLEINSEKKLGVWKIDQNRGGFYLICSEENLDKFADHDIKTAFEDKNFDYVTPPQAASLRSVMAKQLDSHIDNYNNDEIKVSVEEQNEWAKVEELRVVVPKAGPKMVKIRFQTKDMAARALTHGIMILSQSIPHWAVEKEVYVPLNPCTNCFAFEHTRRNCDKPIMTICSKCSLPGHKRDTCNIPDEKCLHCDGPHVTFFAQCPAKKAYLRKAGKAIRDKEKKTTVSPNTTFATQVQAQSQIPTQISEGLGAGTIQFPPMSLDFTTKIISAIAYAHFMDEQSPGCFQEVIDDFYTLNGLPLVKFPRRNYNKTSSDITSPAERVSHEMQTVNINNLNNSTASLLAVEVTDAENNDIEEEATMSTRQLRGRAVNRILIQDNSNAPQNSKPKQKREDSSRRKPKNTNTGVKRELKKMELAIYFPKSWEENGPVDRISLVEKMIHDEVPFNHKCLITSQQLKDLLSDLTVNGNLKVDEIKFVPIDDTRAEDLLHQQRKMKSLKLTTEAQAALH